MGKHDSSKTRVEPVFHRLYAIDPTGRTWLRKLLCLPICGDHIILPLEADFTIQDHGWGDEEKKLDPPVALLSWLIRHPRKPLSGELSSDPAKVQKRLDWIAGSEKLMLEGLSLLRNNPSGENWHIFEGPTQPDVFIQTPDLVVVIEGKRTEPEPTTITKWMPVRHQMLRHIDCAWEIAGKRKVIGFFIVEGNGAADIPARWLEFARQTVSPDSIASSLPHRGPEEQRGIAAAFAGVTTWQAVCEEFGIPWNALPKTVNQ